MNPIRVETAFSRYPVHQLAKKGGVQIEIEERDEAGELRASWDVSYNSRFGHPGQLAYKVDTIVVNRRIDEEGRPLPKVIRLGSLRDICRELNINEGQATRNVKRALHQNASAYINAKITYTASDRSERYIEFGATRYDVVFTGKKLPDGRRADAVYIILHDLYRELLDGVQKRPLDYEYLKELPPGPQRFYELLSFQMYAALKHGRPRARLLYSEYCIYAPQVRYFDYDHVKKQMYKVHAPHRKSDYISAVEFRETKDREGQSDWEMLYTPGSRAKAEFRAFTQPRKAFSAAAAGEPQPPSLRHLVNEDRAPADRDPLVEQLLSFGVAEAKAQELVNGHREAAEAQIAAYPYRDSSKPKKNAAGWLIAAIEGNFTLPVTYLEEQEKKHQAERSAAAKVAAAECQFCDEKGWRRVRTPNYPNGAMKRCTHDPEAEAKYSNA
ncbi:MAG: hypothetical protein M3362_02705 [Acidobacteriota bacterium]|nr:hypothetical protein [Acidobacteriota bacterium]